MELEPIVQPQKLKPILSNQHTLPAIILEGRKVLKNTAYIQIGKQTLKFIMTSAGLFHPEGDPKEVESAEKIKLEQKVKLTTTVYRRIFECRLG